MTSWGLDETTFGKMCTLVQKSREVFHVAELNCCNWSCYFLFQALRWWEKGCNGRWRRLNALLIWKSGLGQDWSTVIGSPLWCTYFTWEYHTMNNARLGSACVVYSQDWCSCPVPCICNVVYFCTYLLLWLNKINLGHLCNVVVLYSSRRLQAPMWMLMQTIKRDFMLTFYMQYKHYNVYHLNVM